MLNFMQIIHVITIMTMNSIFVVDDNPYDCVLLNVIDVISINRLIASCGHCQVINQIPDLLSTKDSVLERWDTSLILKFCMRAEDARNETLDKINNAKFGWVHIKTCLVSGIGFYTDAYDLFVISLAVQMIGYVYYVDENNKVPANTETGIKMSALIGTLIGQLLFGYLADKLGRKRMYGTELLIIVFTTFTQCLAADTVKGMTMVQMLIFWRLFLGIGIGGDYPLSAIITSEMASTKRRGAMIAAVFAMQGFGIMTGSLVSVIVLAICKHQIVDDPMNIDYVWRTIIGIGAIPGIAAIYFRMTIPETARFKIEVKGNIAGAIKDTNDLLNEIDSLDTKTTNQLLIQPVDQGTLREYLSQWKNFKILLGTSVTWFALDVAFYGINLNNPTILKAIGFTNNGTPYDALSSAALGNFVIVLLGTVPGYWVTVFLVDSWGRKKIQLMGFTALTVLFLVLGIFFNQIKDTSTTLFVILYTLANFFTNFGPNATTFIIPGEVFPTRYRSTCHGISAASGKLGAIVSQIGFLQMKDIGGKDEFIPKLIIIFGVFMFIGLLFTFLIPETKGRSLEEIAEDPRMSIKNKTYLE